MEYLFRGKDIQTGEWIEGFYFETGNHSHQLNGWGWIVAPDTESHEEISGCPVEDLTDTRAVDMDTVGMWTGFEAEWFSFEANQSECKIWKDQLIDVTFAKDILPTLCRVTMSNGRWVCISVKDESKIESLYRVLKHLEYSLHR